MTDCKKLKISFINAVASNNKAKARRLLNLLRLGDGKELPLFIDYKTIKGKIFININNGFTISKNEFEQLKEDVSQFICWNYE